MATITRTTDRERELMRRKALVDQGPNDEQVAGGSLPINVLLRALGDPQDPTNVSFPFLRRMRRDHMVAMGLHFIAMPIVQAPWYYECEVARVAAFADNLIRPIYGSLVQTLLRFLWAGYSPAVKNFEVIQPTWKFRDIDGVVKPVWDNGDIGVLVYKEIIPLRPESAMPKYSGGRFNGIDYDDRFGNGAFIITGEKERKVDLMHSIWATHDRENEDGSPYGFPRIAHVSPIFHMYRWIWTLLGRAFENSADPGPVVRYPLEDLPTLGTDGAPRSNVKTALKIGTRKRSGSTIAMPSDVYKDFQDKPTGKYLWDIEYPKGDTNFEQIIKFLGFLESAKLRGLWIQEQGLIEGSGSTSNRNVAEEFGDKRDESQQVLMGQIDAFIDDVLVRPAVQIAFPTFEGTLTKRTIGMGSGSSDMIRQIFQLAGQENWRKFGIDVRRLAEANGFPMVDPVAQDRIEEEETKKASEAAQRPAIEPKQGRRALVTQTGFGETIYEQLGDHYFGGPLELSTDGDFVAGLPSIDAFEDKANIAAARELRTLSDRFLGWSYRDFAIYVGKQTIPEFGVVEDTLADDEFLRGDRIKQYAERLMRGWRPRTERLDDYSKGVSRALGKVYDRTASLHFKSLRSRAKIASTDRLAASWLEDRGAETVKAIMVTTRQQIADVLADGVREGKTSKQIAADVREHFDTVTATRAAMIARTEVGRAYNYATVQAGLAAGVKKGQLLDGNQDTPCKKRNGRIVDLEDALDEDLNHPNCTFTVRLLTRATANLEVRVAQLENGVTGRYDPETETILLSPDLDDQDRSDYLLAVGGSLV